MRNIRLGVPKRGPTREQVRRAVRLFLKRGGQIKTLPPDKEDRSNASRLNAEWSHRPTGATQPLPWREAGFQHVEHPRERR